MALPSPSATVFYDGTCGMCHRAVRFIVLRDPEGLFRFAPLDGETLRRDLPRNVRETLPDSLVVLTADGQLLVRAAAVRFVAGRLGGVWAVLARSSRILPAAIADKLYDFVATVRHRVFRREADACPVVPAHLRGRFLD